MLSNIQYSIFNIKIRGFLLCGWGLVETKGLIMMIGKNIKNNPMIDGAHLNPYCYVYL